jgi:hypothetical protein
MKNNTMPTEGESSEKTLALAGLPATACYALDRRPWWKRRLCRFFDHHPMLPELPEWAKDGIVVNTRINFSMWDRLLILVTGNVSVQSWTACENLPGRVETWSHAMPKPPESLSA